MPTAAAMRSRSIVCRTTHADALHQAGRIAEAAALFAKAEDMQAKLQPGLPKLYSMRGTQYCHLLLARGELAEVRERAEYALKLRTTRI